MECKVGGEESEESVDLRAFGDGVLIVCEGSCCRGEFLMSTSVARIS